MKNKKDYKKLYISFVILSLIFGLIFSIAIPMYHVPDEETHINLIYSYLEDGNNFKEETNNYGETDKIIKNTKEKVNIKKYLNFKKRLHVLGKIKKFNIFILRYLPQTIGIIISELFHFPIIIAVTFSEFLAAIFYTLICLFALKKIPIKKELLMMIMLLPMCMQQMASFSYDVTLNSVAFLFISYVIYLKIEKKKVELRDLIKMFIMLGIITLIKVPYILLGLLIFLIPIKNMFFYKKVSKVMNSKKRVGIILLLTSLIVIALFLIAYKYLIKISYFRIILAFIIHPRGGLRLLRRTLWFNRFYYIKTIIGYFGWFDVSVANWFCVFVILSLIFINILLSQKNDYFSKIEKILILLFSVSFICIIIISIYDWTLFFLGIKTSSFTIEDYANAFNVTPHILGVQGRYFIPLVPLVLIPFGFELKIKNKNTILLFYQIFYYAITFGYTLYIIINRYWI